MKIGRKIYYDKNNGDILVDTGERKGSVRKTTVEEDFATYNKLIERAPETVGLIELDYGECLLDFMDSSSYKVNTETKEIEFNYDAKEPDFQEPLTMQIKKMKTKQSAIQFAVQKLIRVDELEEGELEQIISLYDKWQDRINTEIKKDELIRYEGLLYKALETHIADENFDPIETNYRYVLATPSETIDYWVKPTGYENVYSTGDLVIYEPNGKTYISKIDGNDQEPTKDEPYNRYWQLKQ